MNLKDIFLLITMIEECIIIFAYNSYLFVSTNELY